VKRNLTRKILESHLVSGELKPGHEIAVRIDQTLLQDATGTMAMKDTLDYEAVSQGDSLTFPDLGKRIRDGDEEIP